jgi:hypothetical protein
MTMSFHKLNASAFSVMTLCSFVGKYHSDPEDCHLRACCHKPEDHNLNLL